MRGSSEEKLIRRYNLCQLVGEVKASRQEGISIETLHRDIREYKQRFVKSEHKEVKVLLLDIETAPSLGYIWSLWQEVKSMDFIEQDWYMMSWSAKWLGSDEIMCKALPDYSLYKKDPTDDTMLLKDLWTLMDEADVICGHNLDRFDRKKSNARFIIKGMPPPSPYQIIDTLLEARQSFAFMSNRLNDLGEALGVGSKVDNGGFKKLWKQCIKGDPGAWKLMKTYNKQDVNLLEQVYYKLRPYMKRHPNFGTYSKDEGAICPFCGSGNVAKKAKKSRTTVSEFNMYLCNDCGGWSRDRVNLHSKEKKASMLVKIT